MANDSNTISEQDLDTFKALTKDFDFEIHWDFAAILDNEAWNESFTWHDSGTHIYDGTIDTLKRLDRNAKRLSGSSHELAIQALGIICEIMDRFLTLYVRYSPKHRKDIISAYGYFLRRDIVDPEDNFDGLLRSNFESDPKTLRDNWLRIHDNQFQELTKIVYQMKAQVLRHDVSNSNETSLDSSATNAVDNEKDTGLVVKKCIARTLKSTGCYSSWENNKTNRERIRKRLARAAEKDKRLHYQNDDGLKMYNKAYFLEWMSNQPNEEPPSNSDDDFVVG